MTRRVQAYVEPTKPGKPGPDDVGRTMRTPLHPRATARYRGTCARCGEPFPAGERIARYPAGWSHVACPRPVVTEDEMIEAQQSWPTGPLWDRLLADQLATQERPQQQRSQRAA